MMLMTRKGRYWKLCSRGTECPWEQQRMAQKATTREQSLLQSATVWKVPVGGNGETCFLSFREVRWGHVSESYRETNFSLSNEGFSTARAPKVDLDAWQQPLLRKASFQRIRRDGASPAPWEFLIAFPTVVRKNGGQNSIFLSWARTLGQ